MGPVYLYEWEPQGEVLKPKPGFSTKVRPKCVDITVDPYILCTLPQGDCYGSASKSASSHPSTCLYQLCPLPGVLGTFCTPLDDPAAIVRIRGFVVRSLYSTMSGMVGSLSVQGLDEKYNFAHILPY